MLSKFIRRSCRRIQHNKYHYHRYLMQRTIVHHSPSDAIIRTFAAKSSTTLSLSDIISYTGSTEDRMRDYGKFIWNEIPIRISKRVVELHSLPYGLSDTAAITELRELYTHSFHSFRMLQIPDDDITEELFISAMKQHFESLKSAVPLIAHGLKQCISANPEMTVIQSCPYLNGFLDRFHAARLGTRLLTGQYIACKEQRMRQKSISNIVGLIDFECNPKATLESAVDDAARLTENTFGICPDVNIQIQDKNIIRFAYVPSDLHYIFFEVMKNAMRAVCDYNISIHGSIKGELEPIECVIVASQQSDDVTVKISDQGGGIKRENMAKIWHYSFSTITTENRPEIPKDLNVVSTDNKHAPMAGFGIGLPLSRLYARYFGGDLEVISMDGFGTDVFVYLNWLKPDDTRKLRAANALEPIE